MMSSDAMSNNAMKSVLIDSTADQHFGDLRFLPIALRASNFLI
jgi:hypothetical protein